MFIKCSIGSFHLTMPGGKWSGQQGLQNGINQERKSPLIMYLCPLQYLCSLLALVQCGWRLTRFLCEAMIITQIPFLTSLNCGLFIHYVEYYS